MIGKEIFYLHPGKPNGIDNKKTTTMNESIYLQSNKKMVVMVPFTLRVTNIAGWKATILNGRYIDSFLVNFPASYVSGSRSVSSRELTYPQKMAF